MYCVVLWNGKFILAIIFFSFKLYNINNIRTSFMQLVVAVSRTIEGKFWNHEKYFARKWWNYVGKYFSPEDCIIPPTIFCNIRGICLTFLLWYIEYNFLIFSAYIVWIKKKKYDRILFSCKFGPDFCKAVSELAASFTSLSSGNMVDGLPPACNNLIK